MSVNDFIGPNEEVRFVGTYNINNRVEGPGSNDQAGTSGIRTDVAGICGFGLINNSYYYASTGLLGAPRFIYENYSLATVGELRNEKSYLGNCVWQASYPDLGAVGVTASPIFNFGVSSATGIYTGIKNVIIDFSNPNRVLYFIADKPVA